MLVIDVFAVCLTTYSLCCTCRLPCILHFVMLTVTPTDYKEETLLLMFSSCETRKCASVAVNNDNMAEETEFFRVSLERTTTLDSRIALSPKNATVHIVDNDGKHFASAPPSVCTCIYVTTQFTTFDPFQSRSTVSNPLQRRLPNAHKR